MLDDLDRLGPVLVMAGVAALILLWDLLPRGRPLPRARGRALMVFSLLGPAGAAVWALTLLLRDQRGFAFASSMVLDDFSFFFIFLFAAIVAAVILSAQDYTRRFAGNEPEFVALLLIATGAMMLLASSRDLVLIFISLEVTSVSQYIMAALNRDERSSEAGLKYLLLGATASAVILYGMALLFGLTGTTRLVAPPGEPSIAAVVADRGSEMKAGLVMALVFLIGGLGFKTAVVPFQMWVPDVYEGAPTPVAAFLSVASKAAGFAVILRIFFDGLPAEIASSDWRVIFAVVSAISMTLGNVVALAQSNIKRLLGYSSIAQAGYLMVGVAAVAGENGFSTGGSGVLFFIAAYALTNLGAFFAVTAISDRLNSDFIPDYAGLGRRAPLLAGGLGVALVSLTGIPPTAGFVAKLYIFNAAVQADLVWLVVIAVLNSVVSAFYYLRIAGSMFLGEPQSVAPMRPSYPVRLALAVAVVGTLVVGVVPTPLLNASRDAAKVFTGNDSPAVTSTR